MVYNKSNTSDNLKKEEQENKMRIKSIIYTFAFESIHSYFYTRTIIYIIHSYNGYNKIKWIELKMLLRTIRGKIKPDIWKRSCRK